jgi:hypothetical protein
MAGPALFNCAFTLINTILTRVNAGLIQMAFFFINNKLIFTPINCFGARINAQIILFDAYADCLCAFGTIVSATFINQILAGSNTFFALIDAII